MKSVATIEIKLIMKNDVGDSCYQEIAAEDYIRQRDDESDANFMKRAAVVLEFLRHRHSLPNPTTGS